YDLIGLTVPMQRSLFKTGYSFSKLPVLEQLSIWDSIWKRATDYEILSQCIYFIEGNWKKADAEKVWEVVKTWVDKIDNWAHSDGLSVFYAHLMELIPEVIYKQYLEWNKSDNPWKRRQSLVGMLLYSKRRKTLLPASKLLVMVEPLLKDPDYFVQKGLGWALREIGNVYPEEAMAFLTTHIHAITPTAFATATEKISASVKQMLKFQRKRGHTS
ncbi:MAG TPA: DNA alkylation repair protein, partial [Pedobacter sp.]|uniref:DNA alkylation repair protein n=1 Tax=Pedobacter sp. TaxID=1411316 RepID=UPI002C5A5870